jgi:hypothetical protein
METENKKIELVTIFLQVDEDGAHYSPYSSIYNGFFKLPTTPHQMAGFFMSFFKPFLDTISDETKKDQYVKETLEHIEFFLKNDFIDKVE